ncbi:MAG: hypothetical protein Q9228_000155 [Teloschistes exilis]
MVSMPHLLEQACSPEGLSITQAVEAFLHGLELGCYLCQVIRDFSKNYENSKFSNSFYHINEHEPLYKNVKSPGEWTDIIEYYTDRRLTFSSDKLPALAGLASRFSNLWGCAYYAGLWQKKMIKGLGWFVLDPSTSLSNGCHAPSWSWASVIGQVSWMEKLPTDDQAEETPQETPVAPASLIECSITLLNEAVPFGQVTAWSLTIEGVVQWIDWDGQEQVEAKGLHPDSRPIRDSSIGSQFFPEGIVALAYPDYSQLHVPREADVGHSNAPRPGGMEHIFHLGGEEAESNECTLRILIMVLLNFFIITLFHPIVHDHDHEIKAVRALILPVPEAG